MSPLTPGRTALRGLALAGAVTLSWSYLRNAPPWADLDGSGRVALVLSGLPLVLPAVALWWSHRLHAASKVVLVLWAIANLVLLGGHLDSFGALAVIALPWATAAVMSVALVAVEGLSSAVEERRADAPRHDARLLRPSGRS